MIAIKNKKFGSIVYIEWIDACDRSDWRSMEDAIKVPDEVYVKTVGFYLHHDSKFLTVASSIGKSEKNDVGGVWHIPRVWIKKIK